MKRGNDMISMERFLCRAAVVSSIGLSIFCASIAYADDLVSMAPPASLADQAVTVDAQATTDSSNVFNWTEVPANQQVDIQRATFDKGGYVLYDTSGETIVVPFADNNLYVMKFAKSSDDSMYFVNDGSDPILYVPDGGYLENATVSGGRWYPFTDDFEPAQPVYLGIAPTWSDYVGMGWYSDMYCHGGYYCDVAFGAGDFIACPGFAFDIGANICYGWSDFNEYCVNNHPPYRMGYFNRGYYSRGFAFGSHFPDSSAHSGAGWNDNGGAHNFGGDTHNLGGGGGHVFRGATGDISSTSHSFGGTYHDFGPSTHSSIGGVDSSAGRSYEYSRGASSFSGGDHSLSGGSSSGGRSFGGSSSGGHSFGGGGGRSSGGDSGHKDH